MDKGPDQHRKNIRLEDYDYASPGYYFGTISRNLVGAQHAEPLQNDVKSQSIRAIVPKNMSEELMRTHLSC